jgi:hypothetical protein
VGAQEGPQYFAPLPRGPTSERGGEPSFSIVIPCFQAADTVGWAVDSVLTQTTAPHEVIVCDDGSTDDLQRALAPYAQKIVVLHQANRGVAAARNLGLNYASGEFVAVCDADDVYLPTMLAELSALAMTRPDLDILCCDALIEVDGEILGPGRPDPAAFIVDDQRVGILQQDFVPGRSAFRRDLLLDIGGYDESLECAEDWDCWIRLILGGAVAGMVHIPLARTRIHSGSLTASRTRVLGGQAAVLRKSLARGGLSQAEREAATLHCGVVERALQVARAQDAIRDGAPSAVRHQSLAIARDPDQPFRTRMKAVSAAIAPRWARRRARHETKADHRVLHLGS